MFYTRTMAKVYADQGNLKKAEKIYKHLLANEPGRQDLIEALSEIEKRRLDRFPDEMTALFNHWIDLLLLNRNFQKLSKLKKLLKNGR
jgi:hypothetical protein